MPPAMTLEAVNEQMAVMISLTMVRIPQQHMQLLPDVLMDCLMPFRRSFKPA